MINKSNDYFSESKKKRPDRRNRQGFVPPRQVEDHWNLYRKEIYVARPGRGLPAWFLPFLTLVLIIVIVFWIAPAIINHLQSSKTAGQEQQGNQASLLYDENTWTVSNAVADVFASDDLKADRVTQALYNEPVKILSKDCTYGFAQIQLNDSTKGFMLVKDLADYRDSIEPDLFRYKLIVSAPSKRIMSHASQGTLLVEVMMGTVLYADYRGDGISRVKLPDGSAGWISDDGVVILSPHGKIKPPADGAKYFCSTALAFNQVTKLENGQSIKGISTAGIARLAALVNGLELPRSVAAQSKYGQAVTLAKNKETGLVKLELIKSGDLVFFANSSSEKDKTPDTLAICIDQNQVLYVRPGQTSIKLIDLTQNKDLWKQIFLVRRLFN